MFASNTSSASIICNEELILMYAEANAQLGNFANAKTAPDLIRTTFSLPVYAGALTTPALIDEGVKATPLPVVF